MENNNNEDDEITLEGPIKLKRCYDYDNYSSFRIKEILNDHFGMHLERIRAYKEGRYPGYKQRYNLCQNITGRVIRENVHLDDFRYLFAKMEFPLKEERNLKAAEFLRIVNEIVKEYKNTKKEE